MKTIILGIKINKFRKYVIVGANIAPMQNKVQNSILAVNYPANKNRKNVVVNVEGGLGNRLRALISGMYLAERFELPLLLNWSASSSCDCEFHDLFHNDVELVAKHGNMSRKNFHESVLSGPVGYYGKRCAEDPDLAATVIIPDRESDIDDDSHIVYDSPKILKFIGRNARASILHSFEINKTILSNAEEFCARHRISKNTYGVHIRRTDHTFRNNKHYIKKMDAIVSEDSSARFFVCSDSKEAEQDITEKYPERVITKPKKSYAKKNIDTKDWVLSHTDKKKVYNVYRDKQSVIEALEDLVILTRTTFSIRSNGSFSDIVEWWNPGFEHTCRAWKNNRINDSGWKRFDDLWMDQYLKYLQDFTAQYETVRLRPFTSNVSAKDGISIITASRDRSRQLKESLESWCECSEVTEIIIVDWSSEDPLAEWIQNYDDNRIISIRVDDQDRWILAHAYNLAARFATCKQLCKMDADFRVDADFFKHHCLEPGIFYSGDHRQARNTNEKHLNGFLFLAREDFFRANGYNERVLMYGWEDTDLYKRLTKVGLKRKSIDNNSIEHIQHNDTERIPHYQGSMKPDRAIQANKRLCKNNRWKPRDRVRKYYTERVNQNYFRCTSAFAVRNKNKRRLIMHVERGLGSRLGALATGMVLSAQTKRQFLLVWNQTPDCDCLFGDLFENRLEIVDPWDRCTLAPDTCIYDVRSVNDQVRHHRIDNSGTNDIYIHARSRVRNRRIRLYMEEIVLQQLIPKFDLRKRISALSVSNMIGVHVRTEGGMSFHDNSWDEPGNWSTREVRKLNKWRGRTQPENFFDEIDLLIKKEPNVRFFLCTDRPEHYDAFLTRYGKARISYIPRERFDRSREQLESAVVDLYLLSQTRYILGSGFSYFSDVAERLGGKSIRLAGQDF